MPDLSSRCPASPLGADITQMHVETRGGGCECHLSVYNFILSSLFKWELLTLKLRA